MGQRYPTPFHPWTDRQLSISFAGSNECIANFVYYGKTLVLVFPLSKYRDKMKMTLLLFSRESVMLARIVRPAIQSLSWIIKRKPYSFSMSNWTPLLFQNISFTHFMSLWLKKKKVPEIELN